MTRFVVDFSTGKIEGSLFYTNYYYYVNFCSRIQGCPSFIEEEDERIRRLIFVVEGHIPVVHVEVHVLPCHV